LTYKRTVGGLGRLTRELTTLQFACKHLSKVFG